MAKKIAEINKMRDEAEEKIGIILTELLQEGVTLGNIHVFTAYADENRKDITQLWNGKYKLNAFATIALHLQPKPHKE